MAIITVKFNKKQLDRFFSKLKKRIKNANPILRTAMATIGFRDIIKHFENEKGPEGPWVPLKTRVGKILQDTGNLRGNFLPTNIKDSGKNEIIFFNPTPYARQHDKGDPSRNIPQREFMYLSRIAEKRMAKFVSEALIK